MGNERGTPTGGRLEVICPSCEGLLSFQTGDKTVSSGETMRLFCDDCRKTVEVTAPNGVGNLESPRADALAPASRRASEFVEPSPRTDG